jgi:protein involved in polysaccharide export with SLBB domain
MRSLTFLLLAAVLLRLAPARAADTNQPAPAPAPAPALARVANVAVTNLAALTNLSPSSLDGLMLAALMDSLDDKQKLGAGDKLNYRVIEDQDQPVSLTVTDAGDVDVPYYGLLPAGGKTCRQLAQDVKSQLEKQLYYRATVLIGLELLNKQRTVGRIYVVGQVKQTGPQFIPDNLEFTVSKAILAAGGFSDFADKKKVRVIRAAKPGGSEKKSFTVNVADIWQKGRLESDLKLEPDDLVYVPARLVNL